MSLVADQVRQFHERAQVPLRDAPVAVDEWDDEEAQFRLRLIEEEFAEVYEVLEYDDETSEGHARILHELADLVYVTYGAALTFGWDLDAAIDLVHKANMAKLGDPLRRRADGKILKPADWQPADVSSLVAA